jgi:hypothetical protein
MILECRACGFLADLPAHRLDAERGRHDLLNPSCPGDDFVGTDDDEDEDE